VPAQADTTRPLRVLVVHDSLSENGAVRLTLDLADRLRRLGAACEVFALQPARDGPEAEAPPGVPVSRGVPVGGRLRSSGPAAAVRLLRACRRADVVVSGSEVGLGLLSGSVAARLARRPLVVVVHAPLERVLERWVAPRWRGPTRRAHRRADAAICVTAALAADEVAMGIDVRRVHVVPNAVDVERLRRLAAAEPVPPEEPPNVLGFGRLSSEKGFDLLVRAHAELLGRGVEHRLEVIGHGPEHEPLLRLAAELGVADSCSLPGFVENPFPRLARAAALVLPSRHEGQPLVLLEALALEVPVLASRSAGAADLLGADELFAAESVPALVAALERHLKDPGPLRKAARTRAEAVHSRSPDDVARDYLRILEPAARKTGTARRPAAAYE
jgi:glycosyltransferase involved in cell wall biosynthesis